MALEPLAELGGGRALVRSRSCTMSLPPIFVHHFRLPLPYARALALQERLHALQLAARRENGSHKDLLLLLEHRPVYTAGRRQEDTALAPERARLSALGAELVSTQRGGELTYHGPGQMVGYPLIDLGRTSPPLGIRDYICALQTALKRHLRKTHGVHATSSEHTGVFLDAHTKIASIGVQVRHRLTTHGFSLNVTNEPRKWFDQVVACGLADVSAGSIERATRAPEGTLSVAGEVPALTRIMGEALGRDMHTLDVDAEGEVGEAIREVEENARKAGDWLRAPKIDFT